MAEPFPVRMDEEGLGALAALARRVQAAAETAAGGRRATAFADLALAAAGMAAWAAMARGEVKAGGAVSAEFRGQAAAFMARNDELLRRLAASEALERGSET